MPQFVLASGKTTANPLETWLDLKPEEIKELDEAGALPANVKEFLKQHEADKKKAEAEAAKAAKAKSRKPADKKPATSKPPTGQEEAAEGSEAGADQQEADSETSLKQPGAEK